MQVLKSNVILSAAKNLGYNAGIRLNAAIEILHPLRFLYCVQDRLSE